MRMLLLSTLILAAAPALSRDLRDLAEDYATLPQVQAMWDDALSPLHLANQFRLNVPLSVDVSSDQMDRIGDLLAREMTALRPMMEAVMVDRLTDMFTAEELEALVEFYQSEHGASVMQKMPMFTTLYSAELAPMMQAAQREVAPEIARIMAE
ncbi:MAG: DUF2059 domain-containing protein [Pseudomonadota bacterium]|nr:DUF2059 domain-containing protein [Pseudomonadota bacterium]